MTIREWLAARSTQVPEALSARVLALLGPDADAQVARAGEVFLQSARRALESLLAAGRFGRDTALDLLAVDALTTFAFEHASEAALGAGDIKVLAVDGARTLSGIAANG
ncbi:MAG TPA: hypothetical protein VF483_12900 [Gemmatimonadaceae bacterium]